MRLKTYTPVQRIGIIIFSGMLLTILITAAHWNIFEKPFLYKGFLHEYDPSNTVHYYGEEAPEAFPPHEDIPLNKSCVDAMGEGLSLYDMGSGSRLKAATKCSALPIKSTPVWKTSFPYFIKKISDNNFLQASFITLIISATMWQGIIDRILNWIKTGYWKREAKEKKERKPLRLNLSPIFKKFLYGSVTFTLWASTILLIKNSEIVLGAAPYAAIMMFWFWAFCKAIGRNFWNFKRNDQ